MFRMRLLLDDPSYIQHWKTPLRSKAYYQNIQRVHFIVDGIMRSEFFGVFSPTRKNDTPQKEARRSGLEQGVTSGTAKFFRLRYKANASSVASTEQSS